MKRKSRITKKLKTIYFGKFGILLFFLLFGFEQKNAQVNIEENKKYPTVEIPGTQLREIFSSIVGQEYILQINLPRDFGDTTKTFPVVYLLDGQWDFPLVSAIYGQQYFDGFLPSLIIVGITWGGEDPNPDILRARDFTPTDLKQYLPTGNAHKFIEFIEKELIPFMELNYWASPNDRALMGSSLGGLFTLYTLFNHPHIFNKYVLTSPALGWDNGITYTYEKNYASSDSQLPAKLYMAFGEKEGGVEAFNKFVNVLEQHDYKSLEFSTKILEGIGHSGTKAEGYTRGLQFVFSRPSLKLSNEILDEYTGIYEMSNKMKITVEKENGDLIVIVPFDGNIKLEAESENKFYIKGQFLKVLFQKDENKNVTGFELQRYDRTQFGIKIK